MRGGFCEKKKYIWGGVAIVKRLQFLTPNRGA